MHIPVIMYHAIAAAGQAIGTQEYDDADYTVGPEQFRREIHFLYEQGFETPALEDISSGNLPPKPVLITFDDGHVSDAAVALPVLQEFNMHAVFFVTTDWIGAEGYMSEQNVKALSDAGMALGSHGASHEFFNDMNYTVARDELLQSTQRLRAITGVPCQAFSAPGGQIPKRWAELARECKLDYIFTSQTGQLTERNFPMRIPRVAMRADQSAETFAAIVNLAPAYYRRALLRNSVLGGVRRVIGNSLYMSLRERFV